MGSHIVEALQQQGKHKITAITRPDSQNVLPSTMDAVMKTSYDDHAALVSALTGQDALIITMRAMSPPENQLRLIDAAVEAGVTFIMPNEYGTDQSNVSAADDTKLGPALRTVRKYIEDTGKGKTHWVALSCSFWYEFSLAGSEARYGFDFDKKAVSGDEIMLHSYESSMFRNMLTIQLLLSRSRSSTTAQQGSAPQHGRKPDVQSPDSSP